MLGAQSVLTKGAPTAPSKMVSVVEPAGNPMTVEHEVRLVVCGDSPSKVRCRGTRPQCPRHRIVDTKGAGVGRCCNAARHPCATEQSRGEASMGHMDALHVHLLHSAWRPSSTVARSCRTCGVC